MQASRTSQPASYFSSRYYLQLCSRVGIAVLLILSTATFLRAQGVAINNTAAAAAPSAQLDVASTNKGILIPRIADINSIASPADGLLIYRTDVFPHNFYYYDREPPLVDKWVPLDLRLPFSGYGLGFGGGDHSLFSISSQETFGNAVHFSINTSQSTGAALLAENFGIGYGVVASGSTAGVLGTGQIGVRGDANGQYGGYFTSNYSGSAQVVRAEYTGTDLFDGKGVTGIYQPSAWYGFGGYFAGGYYGVSAIAETQDFTGSRTGVYGRAAGGNSDNFGVYGSAEANSSGTFSESFGLYGAANGLAGKNVYGVYGTSFGTSATRYAGYFSGNLAYTGSLINASDLRFKEHVTPVVGVLSKLMQLKPSSFEFSKSDEYKDMNFDSGRHFGLIAQDVEKVFPELVVAASQPSDLKMKKGGSMEEMRLEKERDAKERRPISYKGVKYMELIPILISAVQSQQDLIQGQQALIQDLQAQVNVLSKQK